MVNTIFSNPGVNDVLRFKNVQNQVKCPIKIYVDFESLLIPIDDTSGHTKLYQKHVPVAFCIYVVSRIEGFSMKPITYLGEGAAKKFVSWIEQIAKRIFRKFENTVPMIFDEEAKSFTSRNMCVMPVVGNLVAIKRGR